MFIVADIQVNGVFLKCRYCIDEAILCQSRSINVNGQAIAATRNLCYRLQSIPKNQKLEQLARVIPGHVKFGRTSCSCVRLAKVRYHYQIYLQIDQIITTIESSVRFHLRSQSGMLKPRTICFFTPSFH